MPHLQGWVGSGADKVYATPVYGFPQFTMKIVHREMFNILLALRVWGHYWRHSIIEMHCNNLAVVQVVATGKTKDLFVAACIHIYQPLQMLTLGSHTLEVV